MADLRDANNHMRHATINEMNDSFLRPDAKWNAQPQIGGLGHLQNHEVSG